MCWGGGGRGELRVAAYFCGGDTTLTQMDGKGLSVTCSVSKGHVEEACRRADRMGRCLYGGGLDTGGDDGGGGMVKRIVRLAVLTKVVAGDGGEGDGVCSEGGYGSDRGDVQIVVFGGGGDEAALKGSVLGQSG